MKKLEPRMKRILSRTFVALAVALSAGLAHAQAWPAKPIRMIVPYPAGGIDNFARAMNPRSSRSAAPSQSRSSSRTWMLSMTSAGRMTT